MASRRSSGSASTPSGPPHASSWAAPPEFYLDENVAGRTLAQSLRRLGYLVHTPPELYGSREAAEGTADARWLADVGQRGWVVISRDARILSRPDELAAYRSARVHMVLYPGQATRAELVAALEATLGEVCAIATRARPGVWRVHRDHGRWRISEL